ncbi:MAG: glycosyltransferase family 2 protein [Sphingomonadales bacterium]
MSGPSEPRVSIAMASYNGGRFIEAQLDSFATQTRLPDEVVICDDGSTDDTAAVVERFAARAPFPVHFHVNPKRLGYTRNFERAILLCRGDIVFLSDQDDVWFADKLAAICRRFEADPAALVVVNDQIMTDGELRPGNATKLGNLRRLGQGSDGLIEGCCTAIRRQWAEIALPLPDQPELIDAYLLSYDRWLNELAILLGIRRVEERPLQLFRRHGGNVTGWVVSEPRTVGLQDLIAMRSPTVPVAAWQSRIALLDVYTEWLGANRPKLERQGITGVDRALAAIDHERASLAARTSLTRMALPRRIPRIAALLGRGGYRYFHGWKSALRDIVRADRSEDAAM